MPFFLQPFGYFSIKYSFDLQLSGSVTYSASFDFFLYAAFLSIVHVESMFSELSPTAFLLLMSVQKLGFWCQIVPIDPCLFLF